MFLVTAASSKSALSGNIAKFVSQLRYNHSKDENSIHKHIVSEHNISCWLSNDVKNLFPI